LPGLVYWLIRRDSKGLLAFLLLILGIPIAFALFGPLWALVIFRDTTYSEFGLYPFIATCIIIPITSLAITIRMRTIAENQIEIIESN